MLAVGTKALLINVSGKTNTKVIHCTPSIVFENNPMIADNHDIAKVNSINKPNTSTQSQTLASGLKPTSQGHPKYQNTMGHQAIRLQRDT